MTDQNKISEDNSVAGRGEVVISKSPLPKEGGRVEMSFFDALFEVAEGKKITKAEWKDENYYGFMHDNKLQLWKSDGRFYDWIISDGDIAGKDWYVLK